MKVEESISLLGFKAQDKVTGFAGVVTSISFDLFGCIQAIVLPPVDKDGNDQEGRWYDIARLDILEEKRVMDCPKFFVEISDIKNDSVSGRPFSSHLKGPAEKPIYSRMPIK